MKQVKNGVKNFQIKEQNSFRHHLVSDEEFQANMDVLIAVYQLLKKESEKRFAPMEWEQKELLAS